MAEDVVVRDAFTPQMAEAGKALLQELDKGSWRPPAAFWLFVPEAAQWRLLLADPELSKAGPRSAYQHIFDALKKVTPARNELTLHDIAVVDPQTPIVRLLQTAIRTGPGISGIRFSRNVIDGHFVEDAYVYRLA
jgi:hypothetical protein